MKKLLSLTVTLGFLAFLALSAIAQNAPPGSDRQPSADTSSARAFEGKILKAGGKFVLRDAATHESYLLDDQEKAKQFVGKDVKVTATMDPYSNSLHVVDIAPVER
jgi:hypothetical protein